MLVLTATSCNNAQPEASSDKTTVPAADGTTVAKPVIASKMDPVCEMELDPTWTESTVYMDDTIKFCSENCKTAFLARPEKYMKAK